MNRSSSAPFQDKSRRRNQLKNKAENERDLALVRKIAKGDEEALEEFYRIYESRVYAFALRRLNNPYASGDILNEVMWAVWRGAKGFEGRATVTTWVMGIAHHKIMDHFRARHKHDTDDLDPETPEAPDQNVMTIINQFQEAEHLRQALNALSDEHRQVLHLAFFDDLSGREISEIIGCPEATVRTRIHYAKKALKHWLTKRCD